MTDTMNLRVLTLNIWMDPRDRAERDALLLQGLEEHDADIVFLQEVLRTPERDAYQIAGQEFTSVIANLRVLIRKDLVDIEKKLESAGAPWTPGRILGWQITEPAETSR